MRTEKVFALRDRLESLGFIMHSMTQFQDDFGYWDCNEKITIVVDDIGVVWTRNGPTQDEDSLSVISKISTKGKGALVAPYLKRLMQQ